MGRFALMVATTALLVGIAGYAYLRGRFDVLHRAARWTLEVNSVVVPGDVLVGRVSALVIRRDKAKGHSYLVLYEGDVDQEGDVGQVIDCGSWAPPKLPILVQTSSFPDCTERSEHATASRMPLKSIGTMEQFTTIEGDVVSIKRR